MSTGGALRRRKTPNNFTTWGPRAENTRRASCITTNWSLGVELPHHLRLNLRAAFTPERSIAKHTFPNVPAPTTDRDQKMLPPTRLSRGWAWRHHRSQTTSNPTNHCHRKAGRRPASRGIKAGYCRPHDSWHRHQIGGNAREYLTSK